MADLVRMGSIGRRRGSGANGDCGFRGARWFTAARIASARGNGLCRIANTPRITCAVRECERRAGRPRSLGRYDSVTDRSAIRNSQSAIEIALGPVSRILFRALRRFDRHFSQFRLAADLSSEAQARST